MNNIRYLKMGNQQSIQKVGFEDMQYIVEHHTKYVIINTLDKHMQHCLITHTISIDAEESVINTLLSRDKFTNIVIYGNNANDVSIYDKYEQLAKLGFTHIYVYPGGMFEWLCLQDIYGSDLFSTNKKELDILKYKPNQIVNKLYIMNDID